MAELSIGLAGETRTFVDIKTGKVFERGTAYVMEESVAKGFLAMRDEQGSPYFSRTKQEVSEEAGDNKGVVTLPENMKKGATTKPKLTITRKGKETSPAGDTGEIDTGAGAASDAGDGSEGGSEGGAGSVTI